MRTRTRSCWGVLPGSTFVSRRSRPEHTSAAAMRSQTKLLGNTQVAGEYSLAMGSLAASSCHDAISLQTMFC